MPTNDYRNYLMHHGILGQKWGVRRYQNADGSLTSKGQKRYSRQERKALKKQAKIEAYNKRVAQERALDEKIKKMSDKELRDSINRINMERTYKSMVSSKPQNQGREVALNVLKIVGETAAIVTGISGIASVFNSTANIARQLSSGKKKVTPEEIQLTKRKNRIKKATTISNTVKNAAQSSQNITRAVSNIKRR